MLKGDDIEAVGRIEMLDDVQRRLFGLRHLFPFHAARGIDDQNHIFGDDLIHLHAGGDQEQEEAILARFAVAEQIQADIFRRDGVVQFKIFVGGDVGVFITGHGAEIPIAVDGHGMAGRVDGPDLPVDAISTRMLCLSSGVLVYRSVDCG